MIRFILITDSLNAHQVRTHLAKNKTRGVKVGNFSQLLDMLFELWLLPPVEDKWSEEFRKNARSFKNAFWQKSLKVDEAATLSEIKSSLSLLLEGVSLRVNSTLADTLSVDGIKKPRIKKYFSELIDLWLKMDGLRPYDQMRAKIWLENKDSLSIEDLQLELHLDEKSLPLWQQEIVTAFSPIRFTKGQANSEKRSSWVEALSEEKALQEEVAKDLLPICVSAKNSISESELIASIVQREIETGIAPNQLAIMAPQTQDYRFWLTHYLNQAGINVSNNTSDKLVTDWQAQLIKDLLTYQLFNKPIVQAMSIISNPLMPWHRQKGQYYATRLGSRHENELKKNPQDKKIIDCVREGYDFSTSQDIEELFTWLDKVLSYTQGLKGTLLSKERMDELVNKVKESFFDYTNSESKEQQLQQVISQLQAHPIQVQTDERHRLDAVTLLDPSHPYLGDNFHRVLVAGFNDGNYEEPTPASGAIPFNDWAGLKFNLNGEVSDFNYPHPQFGGASWIKTFAHNLAKSNSQIIITKARRNYDGSRLHLSNNWIALAKILQAEKDEKANKLIAKPDSETLFTPVEEITSHDLIQWIETPKPSAKDTQLPTEFKFSKSVFDLLNAGRKEPRKESPSSLETMMVSPLAWLFNRSEIETREWEVQTLDIMLQGTIAHKVFENYCKEQNKDFSLDLFEKLFGKAIGEIETKDEEEVVLEAKFINQPQWRIDKTNLKTEVQKAFEVFVSWLKETGWEYFKAEGDVDGELFEHGMKGYIDAILTKDDKTFILDFKKSKHDARLKRLNAGFDLQTYVYRKLYKANDQQKIITGYFNLNDQVMVTDEAIDGVEGLEVKEPNISSTAQSVEAVTKVKKRFAELRAGRVVLNAHDEVKGWEDKGITPYAFDNELLALTMAEASQTNDEDKD